MQFEDITPKGKYLEKITEFYAFVSSDSAGEGLVAFQSTQPLGMPVMIPMVCADKARVDSLREMAIKISKESGKKIKLIRFSVREDLEVIAEGKVT